MATRYLLFHGRHLLHTAFQERALSEAIGKLGSDPAEVEVVFAITSANHANSRYNPVPFHYRAIGVDRFASRVLGPLGARWSIVPVPHFPPSEKFVQRVLSYARAANPSLSGLIPETSLVLCSTPPLITQFTDAGFTVDTAEYDVVSKTFSAVVPQEILRMHAATLSSWKDTPELVELLSSATRALWEDYPEIPLEIERLWNEALLTEHGDITETRDYGTYSFSMSRTEVIDRKYEDILPGIVPGVIVDEGCADGALLARIAADFPDSDLIGIEITREFLAEAHERQRRGGFGNSFVFFYQRNLGEKIFDDATIDTTICNSTTHEIWSYGGGDPTLRAYLAHKYRQSRPGGALLIRDVIGPENGDEEIFAWFNDEDGVTPTPEDAGSYSISELSTRGRFYRFSKEFFNGRGVAYTQEEHDGRVYVRLARKDAADFMSKMTYADNWESELHESFTHWSYTRWCEELEDTGFSVDTTLSHTYTNPWIEENCYQGAAELFALQNGELVPEAFPPTTIVLVAHA